MSQNALQKQDACYQSLLSCDTTITKRSCDSRDVREILFRVSKCDHVFLCGLCWRSRFFDVYFCSNTKPYTSALTPAMLSLFFYYYLFVVYHPFNKAINLKKCDLNSFFHVAMWCIWCFWLLIGCSMWVPRHC